MSLDHDVNYKQLFSHPEMVRDLLRDWVQGDWIAEADFSTLERVNSSYVSENQKQRHDDMVWRLRLNDGWLWVYLLIEFQSKPDPWMALRMLNYVGLLAEDLVKRKELIGGKLPPILPLLLYNGRRPWKVPIEVAKLFVPPPPGLEAYQPRFSYYMLDEIRLMQHSIESVRTAVEALFRLEREQKPDDMLRVIHALDELLRQPGQEGLRRTFTGWIKSLLRHRTNSSNIKEIERIDNFLEDSTMFAERIGSWLDEANRRGVQLGMQQGMLEGMQQGIQQGMQQGIQQGMLEGRLEGKLEGQAGVLAKQLKLRFGSLPLEVVERLSCATAEELDGWVEAVLTAPSLSAVFNPSRH
jgi:predicted transposase YdaD